MKIKTSIISIFPMVILISVMNCVSAEMKEEPINYSLYRKEIKELGYSTFEPLNIEELDETKGKVGPLVLGAITAIGAAGTSVGIDYSNDQPVNWGNAVTAGVGGFVAGASGGLIGGSLSGAAASAALGASASGATNALIGSVGGGSGSCNTCHEKR